MSYVVFDIETVALPESELPPFDESQVALGNCKDPEKVRAKVDVARAEWLAGAALSPLTGSVAMVGLLQSPLQPNINDGLKRDSESQVVAWALDAMAILLNEGTAVVGFNCFSFDLPFLIKRAWKLGVHVPPNIRRRYHGRVYWNENLIDLREEWLMGERAPAKGTSSLDAVAKFLGLPPKLGSGKDFAGLNLDERRAYLTRDLEVTEALYRRLVNA